MVNINQSENENEELKLSPLGTDEINSVIKSFKNSTFNQEKLYQKDKKYKNNKIKNQFKKKKCILFLLTLQFISHFFNQKTRYPFR